MLDGQERLIGVWALDVADRQIRSISVIVNPDKLTHLGPVADFGSLLQLADVTQQSKHPGPGDRQSRSGARKKGS